MNLIGSLRLGRLTLVASMAFALALIVGNAPAGAARAHHHHHHARAKHSAAVVDVRRTRGHGARHRRPLRARAFKRLKPISRSAPTGTASSGQGSSSGVSNGSSVSHQGGKHAPPSEAPALPPAPPATEPTPPPSETPPTQPGPAGVLLFNGSFALGLGEWYEQAISSRVSMVPGEEGGQAARFEVREGDIEPQTGSQRAEVVAPPMFDEGQDLYIHDEIRVPAGNTYNAPWQIIQQLHEDSSENSPGVAVFLENNHSLEINSGDSSIAYWNGPALQTERWYDLTYRVLLSQNPQVGTVEVWLDGVPQVLANGSTTIHGPTATAERTFFKAGVYRSRYSTGTSIVEHSDLAIGSSLAAVEG